MSAPTHLLSGHLLATNVLWSLAGAGLPLVVALWAIPVLVEGLGTERFGLLAIIWMGVGYFSLFDLGIGRAMTRLIADRLARNAEQEVPMLIGTGLTLMLGLGVAAAGIVVAITPWMVTRALNVPLELQYEAQWSFWVLAAALPLVISTAGLIGVLQAYQRFPVIAAVRIPLGIVNFAAPVLALQLTSSLIATTSLLAAFRVAAWAVYWVLCRKYRGDSGANAARIEKRTLREMLSFGGWITVSNTLGPMMVYFDRFLIGALMTLTFVAYYTTPYEVVTKLWILPDALAAVIFPALTMAVATHLDKVRQIFWTSAKVLLIAILPPIAMVVMFAPEGLSWWLGDAFADHSTTVLRWLAIGVFINSVARLASLNLQSIGRPDLNAKLHLAELAPYALTLWILIQWFGIVGAAAGWTLRIAVDAVGLFLLSIYHSKASRDVQAKVLALTALLATALGMLIMVEDVMARAAVLAALIFFCTVAALREVRHLATLKAAPPVLA